MTYGGRISTGVRRFYVDGMRVTLCATFSRWGHLAADALASLYVRFTTTLPAE